MSGGVDFLADDLTLFQRIVGGRAQSGIGFDVERDGKTRGIFAGLGKHRGKRRQPNIALVACRRTRRASNRLDGVFSGGHGAPNRLLFLSTLDHGGFIDRAGIGAPFLNG